MTLRGSIDAFGLPDVLALVGHARKTGSLDVEGPAGLGGYIVVVDGWVSTASSDVRRQSLLRRLVGEGLVGEEAIEALLTAGTPPRAAVRSLMAAGALGDPRVSELAAAVTLDDCCEVLRWTSGTFSFTDAPPDPGDLDVHLAVEEVLAEGARRAAQWNGSARAVPGPHTVLVAAPSVTGEVRLSAPQWRLLALLDGRRSVADLVAVTGLGEYDLVRELTALVEQGLLVPAGSTPGFAAPLAALARLEARSAISRPASSATELPAPPVAAPPAAPAAGQTTAPPNEPVGGVAAELARVLGGASPLAQPGPATFSPPAQPGPPVPAHAGPAEPAGPPPSASAAPAGAPPASASGYPDRLPAHVAGSTAPQLRDPTTDSLSLTGQDAAITRSLLLRLIAGVRGL